MLNFEAEAGEAAHPTQNHHEVTKRKFTDSCHLLQIPLLVSSEFAALVIDSEWTVENHCNL